MAAIDDLINQIEDRALRERLRAEVKQITKGKKFGLVFEDHLPELTPIYNAKVSKGCKVALRDGKLTDLWRVLSVQGKEAHCLNICSGNKESFPVDDLVAVRQFGEPIFPALTPVDKVQNGPDDAPWHTLVEADNYHALQLLEYMYAGKVDCIYIDPPYNTGARDWKYNNDYVDKTDSWRHSKWLSFLMRRLQIAKKLLSDNGVLIITIDSVELCNLGLLLDDIFPEFDKTIVTIVIHGRGNEGINFDRVHEYAIFLTRENEKDICPRTLDSYNSQTCNDEMIADTRTFLRTGNNSTPDKRPKMYYPIWVEQRTGNISIGNVCDPADNPIGPDNHIAVFPVDDKGRNRVWRRNSESAKHALNEGLLISLYDEKKNRWRIMITNHRPASMNHRTVWIDKLHAAATHGTTLLADIIGPGKFTFPKSLYSTRDCLASVVANRPNAIVVDFFAGSGTTLHALKLINAYDCGNRRGVLITNNEVPQNLAQNLRNQGLQPGMPDWEKHGICQSVTWPRTKFTIQGKRENGTELVGEYIIGTTSKKEMARRFKQIAFTSTGCLGNTAKKKQLVALIDGIPQSVVRKDSAYIVSEKHPASILFDDSQADAWLEALEEQEHITDFYIVTEKKGIFNDLRARIDNLLGQVLVSEEEKRPMREGFPVNLEYFRLDFLDKDNVALGRQFREILPILWLRAGAIGPRPELPRNKPIPAMLIPEKNPFAILIEESMFSDFYSGLNSRDDISHAYLVTDSEEAFREMAGKLKVPHVIQLYRDYLENFVINKQGSST